MNGVFYCLVLMVVAVVEYNNIIKAFEQSNIQTKIGWLSVSSLSRMSHLFKVHVRTVTVSDSPFNIQQTVNI